MIVGGFNNLGQLSTAWPSGPDHPWEAYLVGNNLHVWNGFAWASVGNLAGPAGPTGPTGAGDPGPSGPPGPTGPEGPVLNVINDTITGGATGSTWSSTRILQQLNARAMRSGDLGGGATLTTVVGIQGNAVSPNAPATGQIMGWNNAASEWQPMAPVVGNMGGDVTGAAGTSTVVRIQNRDVAVTAPTQGQVLTWQATPAPGRWQPSTGANLDLFVDVESNQAIAGRKIFNDLRVVAGTGLHIGTTLIGMSGGGKLQVAGEDVATELYVRLVVEALLGASF